MPLHDHFRAPLDLQSTWQEFHGQWPANIVRQLRKSLPPRYVAGPHVHSGSQIEIDIATFEQDEPATSNPTDHTNGTIALWAPTSPSLAVETTLPDFDEYEVRIYDARRKRRLVAAIEIVSPTNKDRPEHRHMFVAKCAALIQKGVAVSIVDIVTIRQFNLYREMLDMIGHKDPTLSDPAPTLYATSTRWVHRGKRTILEAWSNELALGQPLPTLPLWLDDELVVPLDLDESYEQTCDDLWIN